MWAWISSRVRLLVSGTSFATNKIAAAETAEYRKKVPETFLSFHHLISTYYHWWQTGNLNVSMHVITRATPAYEIVESVGNSPRTKPVCPYG